MVTKSQKNSLSIPFFLAGSLLLTTRLLFSILLKIIRRIVECHESFHMRWLLTLNNTSTDFITFRTSIGSVLSLSRRLLRGLCLTSAHFSRSFGGKIKTINMADPNNEAASSSSVSEQAPSATPIRDDLEKIEDFLEPDKKRRKLSRNDGKTEQKLEHRLGGILCCAVCLDLPKAAVYQCTNGHLMCAGCFTHVLADARLRDEMATCPNCRIEISRTSPSRNLAVEKAVSELPAECQYCAKEFPRNSLERHEETMCEERISSCKYSRIGCPWRGPNHERPEHEAHCVHPHRSGLDVMDALRDIDARTLEERRLYDNVFDLLSYEKITFNDLQMKPYRTDEFVHKLFYETSRFTAFNNQWVVKARINNSQRDPTQSSERDMTYQLILKSKTTYPLPLHYLILKGPFGDMKVQPRIHKFEFTDQEIESPYLPLPLPDTAECNRLLAARAISFRLIMFLASK